MGARLFERLSLTGSTLGIKKVNQLLQVQEVGMMLHCPNNDFDTLGRFQFSLILLFDRQESSVT